MSQNYDINRGTTIRITKFKTIQWIMLQHAVRNGLYAFYNTYNTTTMIKMFISIQYV